MNYFNSSLDKSYDPFTVFVIIICGYLVLTLIVQVTWNYTLPKLFNISSITFLQALALLILLNVLFGAFGSQCIQIVK